MLPTPDAATRTPTQLRIDRALAGLSREPITIWQRIRWAVKYR